MTVSPTATTRLGKKAVTAADQVMAWCQKNHLQIQVRTFLVRRCHGCTSYGRAPRAVRLVGHTGTSKRSHGGSVGRSRPL